MLGQIRLCYINIGMGYNYVHICINLSDMMYDYICYSEYVIVRLVIGYYISLGQSILDQYISEYLDEL